MSNEQPEGSQNAPKPDAIDPIRRRFYQTITAIGVVVLVVGAFWVISQIWAPISIILFSAFLVFILRTPVAFLESKRVPRGLGAAIMYVVALMVIAGIALIFVPVVAEQLLGFVKSIPQYMQQVGTFVSETFTQVTDFLEESGVQNVIATVSAELAKLATSLASNSATAMFATATSIGIAIVVAALSIIVGFWVLKDLPRFRVELYKLVGPRYSEDVRVVASAFSRALGGYLRGMVVACICTGTLTFIAYTIIGLPYPLVLALFTGLMVFIPFIGPSLAWIVAGFVGFLISPLTGILAVVLTVASQISYDNLVAPRVMGGTVELHPGIILIAIFTGAALGGIFGMLCAIPLTGAAKAIFVYYFEKRTGRQLVSEKGALFKGTPSSATDPAPGAEAGQRPAKLSSRFFRKKKSLESIEEDIILDDDIILDGDTIEGTKQ